MRLEYVHRGEVIRLETEEHSGALRVRLPDSSENEIKARTVEDGIVGIECDDRTYRIAFARTAGEIRISYNGCVYEFTKHAQGRKIEGGKSHSGELVAPMTGAVADVLVGIGEEVAAYQPLVVIEAMKVLATIESPQAGT